jgi:PAS domain S-box-containing protein
MYGSAPLDSATFVKTKKRFIVISRFLILGILFLLLFYDAGLLNRRSIIILSVLAFTNVFFVFLPSRLFEPGRISGWFFVFDTGVVSVLLWFVSNGGRELYLVYYLTIFIAAIGKSASTAFFTCAISASLYALLTLYGKTGIALESIQFAVRTIFFFVTAMFVGYLAEEVRREREAKESALSLLQITQRLASLFEVSKRMVSMMDLGYLQKHILEVAMEVLAADTGSVMLLDREKKELKISAAVGIPEEVRETHMVKVGEGISGWVAKTGEPLLLTAELEHETRFRSLAPKKEITTAICAPLRMEEEILGVLNLNKIKPGTPFRKEDLDLLVTLANFSAIVLEKARLRDSLDVAYTNMRAAWDELAALFESANDAIIVFSAKDGTISRINHEAARLTGLVRTVLLEKKFWDLFSGDDREKLDRLVANTTRTGRARSDDLSVRRGDGALVPVRISASLTGSGESEVIQAVIGDITERIRMEQHLARTERLRALGELATGVAHEFGNIIGAILGYAQRLQTRVQAEADKKAIEVIEKSARDGAEIVRRIQDATRARSTRSYTAVPLGEVVRDSINYTRSKWKGLIAKGARIEVQEKMEFFGCVMGNAPELREVFTNILLNATDAMPSGGAITLETSRVGEMAMVRIKDTGMGMTGEVKERIFDPFFTTKGPEGSGLGLSIAYSIVAAHQGRIDVDSEVGKGSTFTVWLPVSAEVRPS